MLKRVLLADSVFLAAFYFALLPQAAHAYVDLGVGSYMLQMIVGVAAAVWMSMKGWWARPKIGKPAVSTESDTKKQV